MPVVSLPAQHPQRASLHNEIHARPPESIAAPTALTHLVMVCDSAQREASRQHLAALQQRQDFLQIRVKWWHDNVLK
jgi:uncharacterized membrane-anchored protein